LKQPQFLDSQELEALRNDIETAGFAPDSLVDEHADRACIGLNLAVGWPLPSPLGDAYAELAARVASIDPAVYVYPPATTHVTVLTAVNFKRYPNPTADTVRSVDEAADALGDFTTQALIGVLPFELEVGSPVLARAAAFLPMNDQAGAIATLRDRVLPFCRTQGGILTDASAPRAVHSTFLRFRRAPADALAFARAFDEVARDFAPTRVAIDRVLVTLETKPYMRAGSITRTVLLG